VGNNCAPLRAAGRRDRSAFHAANRIRVSELGLGVTATRNCFCDWRGLTGGVEIVIFCVDREIARALVSLTIPELWTFF
jgi:hypothetical protein